MSFWTATAIRSMGCRTMTGSASPLRKRERRRREKEIGEAGCRMPAGRVKGEASPGKSRPLTRPDGEAAVERGQKG